MAANAYHAASNESIATREKNTENIELGGTRDGRRDSRVIRLEPAVEKNSLRREDNQEVGPSGTAKYFCDSFFAHLQFADSLYDSDTANSIAAAWSTASLHSQKDKIKVAYGTKIFNNKKTE